MSIERFGSSRMASPVSGQGGFSLVEILVAMVILITGMASVLALFVSGVSIHKTAMDGTHATLIAESAFAVSRARLAAGDQEPVPRTASEEYPGYDYQIDIFPIDELVGGEVSVKVTIFWRQAKGEGTQVFRTILATDDFRKAIEEARRE